MGQGIGYVSASIAKRPVLYCDVSSAQIECCRGMNAKLMEKEVKKAKMTEAEAQEITQRFQYTTDMGAVSQHVHFTCLLYFLSPALLTPFSVFDCILIVMMNS